MFWCHSLSFLQDSLSGESSSLKVLLLSRQARHEPAESRLQWSPVLLPYFCSSLVMGSFFFFSMRFRRNWKYLVAQTLQHAVSNLQLPKPSKSNPTRDSSFFDPCTSENKNGQQPSSSFAKQIPAAGAMSLEAALMDSRAEARRSIDMQHKQFDS